MTPVHKLAAEAAIIFLNSFLLMLITWLSIHFSKSYSWVKAVILLSLTATLLYSGEMRAEIFWKTSDLGTGYKIIGLAVSIYLGFYLFEKLKFELEGFEWKIKKLEIITRDTDNWSDQWREEKVQAKYKDIIRVSTKIQNAWWRDRSKRYYFEPFIAWFLWGLDSRETRRWLIAFRDEQYKRLLLAREKAKIMEDADEIS